MRMTKNNYLYLDNAATTKPNPEVVALYNEIETEYFANSSSIHALGIKSFSIENKAKESILKTLNLKKYKVIFTASATEANNLAIKGYCYKFRNRGNHLITSCVEHPSVLEVFHQLEKDGFRVTYLPVDEFGRVNVHDLEKSITKETILVSIMSTNNEVGTLNDLSSIAQLLHQFPKIVFHSDTTQSIGKDLINFNNLDMFVISAHKIHGLKGSGCLIMKDNIELSPVINGGGQEYGLRSGTVAVSQAVALAKALQIAYAKISANNTLISEINQQITVKLANNDGIKINSNKYCSPYILNFSLTKKKASVVVEALSNKSIFVSSVSACNSKGEKSSYVVAAMTGNEEYAANTIRLSFDEECTLEKADIFVSTLFNILEEIR